MESNDQLRERQNDEYNAGLTKGQLIAGACREYAAIVGAEQTWKEWILTDRDTFERNPYYTGTPGPHPEDM